MALNFCTMIVTVTSKLGVDTHTKTYLNLPCIYLVGCMYFMYFYSWIVNQFAKKRKRNISQQKI